MATVGVQVGAASLRGNARRRLMTCHTAIVVVGAPSRSRLRSITSSAAALPSPPATCRSRCGYDFEEPEQPVVGLLCRLERLVPEKCGHVVDAVAGVETHGPEPTPWPRSRARSCRSDKRSSHALRFLHRRLQREWENLLRKGHTVHLPFDLTRKFRMPQCNVGNGKCSPRLEEERNALMLIKRPDDIKSSEITDKQLYPTGPSFIRTASWAPPLVGLWVPVLLGPGARPGVARSSRIHYRQLAKDEQRTPAQGHDS